ncbi:MAG: SDR family oxidoreductase [Marivibrio sp.]|uniref:SDR family oxidoreductase n=1 Tax=Marivibrio sp. TaxID=2039719 RepID=UPI0032EF2E00
MPTLLVTGANRGIGREIVRQYAADGWRVIAACREPAASGVDEAETVELDVADAESVAVLAESLEGVAIDLLWNNAGIYPDKGLALDALDYEDWLEAMAVNVLAPIRLAAALKENVAASEKKLMAFTSSQMGSIARDSQGAYVYRSSKAALNMAVNCLKHDVRPLGIATCLLHPGWVRTDMGGGAAEIDVDESVAGMKQLLDGMTLETTGAYVDYRGAPLDW